MTASSPSGKTAAAAGEHTLARNGAAAQHLGNSLFAKPMHWPRIDQRDDFDTAAREIAARLHVGETVAFTYGCLSHFRLELRASKRRDLLVEAKVIVGRAAPMPATYKTINPREASGSLVARRYGLLSDDAQAVAYLFNALGEATVEIYRSQPTPTAAA